MNFTRSFASTTSLRLLSAHESPARAGSASVELDFDKENQKFGRTEWRDPVELVFEPAGWRSSGVHGLRASNARH